MLTLGCGFPRPADVPGDARSGEEQPAVVVMVSTSGDDGSDGLAKPVRTLKRAIGLATTNDLIKTISLSVGRYGSATGESFPYVAPRDVTIAGPVGGGAILVGTGTEPGLVVGAARLRDLEFEDFTVAVTGNGPAELTNIRVRSSMLALRGEASAQLTVDRLDVAGAIGACATGVELNADADLNASNVTTRALGISFQLRGQSTSTITRANTLGDINCNSDQGFIGAFTVTTTRIFSLRDSIVNSSTNGITFSSPGARTEATLSNIEIRNVTKTSVNGRNVSLTMRNGELTGGHNAINVTNANYQIANVIFSQYQDFALLVGDSGSLVLRDCTVMGNTLGIYAYSNTAALDLGSVASRGNNVIQNQSTGIHMDPGLSQLHIDAVGNTWIPDVQGADAEGHYPSMRLVGPISAGGRRNFDFPAGCSLQL
jgi:hypothetical protein